MSHKNFISVIPWDPTCEPHVERLRLQRIACGWGEGSVNNWRAQHLAGEKNLLWLILKPTHPSYNSLISSHMLQFPQESDVLLDSASITFPFNRERHEAFMPIGHVSMDFTTHCTIDPVRGRIGATSLYISPALRGLEFARQVFETMRNVGRYFARYVVAEVPVRESKEALERFEKFGDGRPDFSLADWYESIGWKRLQGKKRYVSEKDTEGRVWKVELVAMEWDLWEDATAEKSRL